MSRISRPSWRLCWREHCDRCRTLHTLHATRRRSCCSLFRILTIAAAGLFSDVGIPVRASSRSERLPEVHHGDRRTGRCIVRSLYMAWDLARRGQGIDRPERASKAEVRERVVYALCAARLGNVYGLVCRPYRSHRNVSQRGPRWAREARTASLEALLRAEVRLDSELVALGTLQRALRVAVQTRRGLPVGGVRCKTFRPVRKADGGLPGTVAWSPLLWILNDFLGKLGLRRPVVYKAERHDGTAHNSGVGSQLVCSVFTSAGTAKEIQLAFLEVHVRYCEEGTVSMYKGRSAQRLRRGVIILEERGATRRAVRSAGIYDTSGQKG